MSEAFWFLTRSEALVPDVDGIKSDDCAIRVLVGFTSVHDPYRVAAGVDLDDIGGSEATIGIVGIDGHQFFVVYIDVEHAEVLEEDKVETELVTSELKTY